ncbi:PucR family transcriptional regulator [Citricoccus sp. GCM10030269]|uniref:PucR family transcriptional regulator n=1 Tax=Citricoccus sp. GCM10030269 TaxID=3273388 RepID=UPI003610BE97
MPRDPERRLRDLLAELESDDAILDETVAELRATIPGYEDIPADSVRASARRNRSLSVRTILNGWAPGPEEIDEPRALMEERMRQGISIASVLAGFRLSMSVILRRLLDLAPRHDIPPERALDFSNLLWALGDAFTTRAVVVHRDHSIAQAVADSARRTHWIRDAVIGGLDRTALLAGAGTYDLPLDRPVRVVRASVSGAASDPVALLESWALGTGARVLAAPRGEGAVGILMDDVGPASPVAGLTIAVGPLRPLTEISESFAGANRVLEAAHRVGWDGVVDAERLSWRMGVYASDETTQLLMDRHVAPVLAEGPFGELVLEALGAYLDHGLNMPQAAASIPVHVNTLRYRLKRYAELTGGNVHALETLIEASWALAAHRGSSPATKPASGT